MPLYLFFISVSVFWSIQPTKAEKTALSKAYEEKFQKAQNLLDAYGGNTGTLYTAKKELDLITKEFPNYAPAYKELARYEIKKGHMSYYNYAEGSLEKAEKYLKKATALDPNFAGAYVLGGHLYRLMDRYPEAMASLKKAEKLGGTDDPWYYNNWGDIIKDYRQYNGAALQYRKAIELNSKNKNATTAALQGLQFCYRKTGQLDKSEEVHRLIIKHQPESAWNYGNYAEFLLCRMDKYEESITQSKKAIEIMPYGAAHYFLSAALYRKWAESVLTNNDENTEKLLAEAQAMIPNPSIFREKEKHCPTLTKIRRAIEITKKK